MGFNHFSLSFSLAENLPTFFLLHQTFPDLRHFVVAKAPQAGTECQCCSGTKCCWREHNLSTCWYKNGRHHHLNSHLSSVCELLSFSCSLQVVDQMSFRVKSPSCWNLPKCYQVRMTTIQTPWIVLLSPVSCGC